MRCCSHLFEICNVTPRNLSVAAIFFRCPQKGTKDTKGTNRKTEEEDRQIGLFLPAMVSCDFLCPFVA